MTAAEARKENHRPHIRRNPESAHYKPSQENEADPDWAVEEQDTPLINAIKKGHTDIVILLLRAGAGPEESCKSGTPLEIASRLGHKSIVGSLIEFGADVNAKGIVFRDALTAATSTTHAQIEIIKVLLENGARPSAKPRVQLEFEHSTDSASSAETEETTAGVNSSRTSITEETQVVNPLHRTMTDLYQDELYQPSPSQTSALRSSLRPYSKTSLPSSPMDLFQARLQEANQSRPPPPESPREWASFVESSQYAPRSSAAGTTYLQTAAGLREQAKSISDSLALAQHLPRGDNSPPPKTISPKLH